MLCKFAIVLYRKQFTKWVEIRRKLMNMKKNVLTILFLSAVLFVGTKAFIALFSYQSAEKIKSALNQEFAITYSWLSSELDGTIVFHDLSITPYRLKRTFHIERLRLNYGNYFNLLLSLSNLTSSQHDGIQSVTAQSIKGLLEGRDFEEWIALEYGNDFSAPLGLYACGDQTRVNHSNLRKMGVNEFKASVTLEKRIDADLNELAIAITLDMDVLGETKLKSTWEASSIPSAFSKWDVEKFQLNDFSLTHVDNGYFRRLSNFCSTLTQFDRKQFSLLASELWQKKLGEIGLDVGPVVKKLYQDYLLQGGQLYVALSPTKPFVLNQFNDLLDKNLIPYFGVSAKLNGDPVHAVEWLVNGQHFRPPVQVVSDEPKNKMFETSQKKKRGYFSISPDELEFVPEQKARIIMLDEKQYQGVIVSVNEQKLELSQELSGGAVVYSLQRDQIKNIEIWQ